MPQSAVRPDTSPENVRQIVESVFRDPELAEGLQSGSGDTSQLVAWLFQKAIELFADLVQFLQVLRLESPVLFYALLGVLVVLLVAILAHIGYTLSKVFGQAPEKAVDDDESPAARVRRFQDLRSLALTRAGEGDYREASRLLLIALIALVEERKVLKVAQGWTNQEIAARLESRAGLDELRDFASSIDAIWYGEQRVGNDDFEVLNRRLDDFLRRLRARGAA
ncbi:MAG: DUF4129 domain-containing protein [Planctomycetota bacterium]